ncbi:MAG: c-type cytochrome [Gemmatirosa sp.]|nr:c-type cytochrome [Gemmatirosa sp.]
MRHGHALGALCLAVATARAQPARAQPATPSRALDAAQRAETETLLRERLPCLGCHALGSEGGRLAPDLATVRQRRTAAYVAAMVDDPQRTVPGTTMPHVVMPASTRALVLRYLGVDALPVVRVASARASARASGDTSGARLYARFCAGCHGTTGGGDGPNARYLPVRPAVHADAAAMGRRTDDRLYDAIAAGGAALGRSPLMPPFGDTLEPAQIAALVRHVRALCRCEQPRWAADGARP